LVGDSCLAGLLHDLGILALARQAPQNYIRTLTAASQRGQPYWEAEQQQFDATLAEIGAYLLALWGLPDPVVQATAFHHWPGKSADRSFSPLTAVHVANAVMEEAIELIEPNTPVDPDYLKRIGCAEKLEKWREICEAVQPERALR